MKKFGLLTTLLIGGLLLTGCNKTIENCEISGECIGETDMDVLEGKCGEYLDKNFVANGEFSQSPTHYQIYMNSGDLEYVRLDSEFIDPYYGIRGYMKVGDLKQYVLCNIYPNGGIHDIHFYNDSDELVVNESEEVIENNENIPLCNDIDLNRDAEIIEIDDVVENCTYEEGTAYSWDKGGCGGVMPQLYITKDKLGMFDLSNTKELCKSTRAGIIRDLGDNYEDINTFVYKYGLYKKGLIDSILPQTEEEINGNKCGFYYCDDENLCSQFYRPSYGENENHYYIYGYRYPKEFPYETLLVIDDKLYRLGNFEEMFENGWPNPIKQGKWVVYGLNGDKLIVKRYVDGELIPPYTLENYSSYSFDEPTTTTKFKVKTCEIPL